MNKLKNKLWTALIAVFLFISCNDSTKFNSDNSSSKNDKISNQINLDVIPDKAEIYCWCFTHEGIKRSGNIILISGSFCTTTLPLTPASLIDSTFSFEVLNEESKLKMLKEILIRKKTKIEKSN